MFRSDASLYCDDVDIRFSKMMNSCKVLQIRYASVERLLERLTDLRFLSIDFLNTFLHSYRVFTSADVVLDKLITIYKRPISAIPARWATWTFWATFFFFGNTQKIRSHGMHRDVDCRRLSCSYSWGQKFTPPFQNLQNVNYFTKRRGIIQNACYCLINTDLNKIFHIKDVCI